MIRIDNLKLFPLKTSQIRIPNVPSKGIYSVIYYPENTSFLKQYQNLKILKSDVRLVRFFGSRYPKLMINAQLVQPYRTLKLMPVLKRGPVKNNAYIDVGPFLDALERQFKISSYPL